MPIAYHVYSNLGNGGPVNFSSPLLTTTDLSCVTGPLGVSTNSTFVVRAFDVTTGLEEANTVATVRVSIGSDGVENTGLPNAPHALIFSAVMGGGCLVGWAYAPTSGQGIPTGFCVYLTQGSSIAYHNAAATIPYVAGQLGYSCLIPGPFQAATYHAAVRSFNSVGTEGNPVTQSLSTGGSSVPYVMEPVQSVVAGP